MKRVLVIGVAPGQKALDEETRNRIMAADLLVSSARHFPLAEGYQGERLNIEGKVSEAIERITANPNLKVAFFASGDPGFFGIGALIMKKIGPDEVEIIPAVSSMQYAFAKAGYEWSDASFVSLHGRDMHLLAGYLGARKIGVFTDATNTPGAIARFCHNAGWDDLTMVVCCNLGEEGERVERGPIADFNEWEGPNLNVVILVRNHSDHRPLGPGIHEERFMHPSGRITKREVRAVAMGLLELPRKGVLWDVGAGSGSVGIEASLLSPHLRVYAVEQNEDAAKDILENRRRFRAAGLTLIRGDAPSALGRLPDPDRVFIGGSGGRISEILDHASARLSPGGIILVSTVLTESFVQTLNWAQTSGMNCEWTEILAMRARKTAGNMRKVAENPVTLLKLTAQRG